MATQWGRKETIVWQPHMPIYSYAAVAIALLSAVLFLWESYAFQQKPLRKAYTTEYVRATFGALFNQHGSYRLLMVGGETKTPRLALPADLVKGETLLPGGASVPVMLSPSARAAGYTYFQRAAARGYSDKSMYSWLRAAIFGNKTLVGAYAWPIGESLFVLILALAYTTPRDIRRLKELKYGRRLKGPVMHEPKAFNKVVRGDGIGIETADGKTFLRIPRANEAQHLEIIGDTGSGKTTLIMRMLQQINERGESAIIYDPACEFVQRFYNEGRGDIILNPLDQRCPYWGPAEELRRKAEAKAIAASLYQPTSDKKGEFFTETPQKIFAHLLTFGPTPQQLVEWMSNPKEIDLRVQGTELAAILEPGAQQQRAGVLASLGLIADSLRMLPTKEQAEGRTWSATQWADKREGWIFITSKATEREALRPLHSLWIDLLVLRLLSAPTPEQRPVWFVLDELASLQRLPQLHTAITENRKSKNPLILGFQGKAQLETIYGHLAEVMLSQPATKIFLKTTEPKAAEWVSKAIGNVEIERMRETHVHGTREGKSFSIDRQTEPLVMDSEIAGLADKHAFLKLGNDVARFSFTYCDITPVAQDFVPRTVEDDELMFDPLTLRPRHQAVPEEVPFLPPTAVLAADPEPATTPDASPVVPPVDTANAAALTPADSDATPPETSPAATQGDESPAPASPETSSQPPNDLAGHPPAKKNTRRSRPVPPKVRLTRPMQPDPDSPGPLSIIPAPPTETHPPQLHGSEI
jgi:type IV secretory pathway TraG/TraD family ATPase VirD4